MSLAGRSQHAVWVIGQIVCVRNRAISALTTRAHTVASIAMQCGTLRSLGESIVPTTLAALFCRTSGEAYLGRNHALVKAIEFVVDELEACMLKALMLMAASNGVPVALVSRSNDVSVL